MVSQNTANVYIGLSLWPCNHFTHQLKNKIQLKIQFVICPWFNIRSDIRSNIRSNIRSDIWSNIRSNFSKLEVLLLVSWSGPSRRIYVLIFRLGHSRMTTTTAMLTKNAGEPDTTWIVLTLCLVSFCHSHSTGTNWDHCSLLLFKSPESSLWREE